MSVYICLPSVLLSAQSPLTSMLLELVGQYMFCEVGTEVPESLAGNATAQGGSSPKQPGPQLPVVTAWQAVVVELVWHDCCPAGQLSGAPHLQHISSGKLCVLSSPQSLECSDTHFRHIFRLPSACLA